MRSTCSIQRVRRSRSPSALMTPSWYHAACDRSLLCCVDGIAKVTPQAERCTIETSSLVYNREVPWLQARTSRLRARAPARSVCPQRAKACYRKDASVQAGAHRVGGDKAMAVCSSVCALVTTQHLAYNYTPSLTPPRKPCLELVHVFC
jgi:hypothetical protein